MKLRRTRTKTGTELHLHGWKVPISKQVVRAFGDADWETQQAVLATLRARSTYDPGSAYVGAAAVLLAFWATQQGTASWLDWIVTALMAVIVMGFLARMSSRRAIAACWLAIYEEEISRRHGERGRIARQWQRVHRA